MRHSIQTLCGVSEEPDHKYGVWSFVLRKQVRILQWALKVNDLNLEYVQSPRGASYSSSGDTNKELVVSKVVVFSGDHSP